jgi:hypothetical protein
MNRRRGTLALLTPAARNDTAHSLGHSKTGQESPKVKRRIGFSVSWGRMVLRGYFARVIPARHRPGPNLEGVKGRRQCGSFVRCATNWRHQLLV